MGFSHYSMGMADPEREDPGQNDLWAGWGQNLRSVRIHHHLTQTGLGELVGVDQTTISDWELGHHAPSDAKKLRLAELLGQSPTELFPWPDQAVAS